MSLEDAGALLLRLTVGALFLMGTWASVKNRAERDFTTAETALVFKTNPRLFAYLGIAMMGLGGLSIIFGVFPRLGALALTIFLVGAAAIHFAKRAQLTGYAKTIELALTGDGAGPARQELSALTEAGVLGHFVAGLKNCALTGATAYLVLASGRAPMLIGFGPGGTLHGLLTRI
jgi:uncharacterized membrane protein YphA (DoxX/SURF4 family)